MFAATVYPIIKPMAREKKLKLIELLELDVQIKRKRVSKKVKLNNIEFNSRLHK